VPENVCGESAASEKLVHHHGWQEETGILETSNEEAVVTLLNQESPDDSHVESSSPETDETSHYR